MDFKNQSQLNDFSFGWKNVFFLRRMWKKHLPDGAPTGRNRCREVRKSPSFSLFGGRKLSKSGWHNERWSFFGAYVLFACLRVVCLILVQEVSKSCGRGHKGFLQMRENRFFSPCVPACPEYAILRRRKWQFDKMIFGQKNIRTKSLLRLENMFFCSYV